MTHSATPRGATSAALLACCNLLAVGGLAASEPAFAGDDPRPDVLVIVLDDIGMGNFGFEPFGWNSAPLTPDMPVLAEIASQGVSFTNLWATPECSPTRAALLTGRYGFRTGVVTAIVDPMLPVNQLHPAEITVPKLVSQAGYRTGMLGKYHLGGGPGNTPPGYGYEAPSVSAGLDFYDGYWALPPAIDQTVGGQAPDGVVYDCGAPVGFTTVGAACFPDGTCVEGVNPFEAMAAGATPLLRADGTLAESCDEGDCAHIDFGNTNAYYAWDRVLSASGSGFKLDAPQREYLTGFISRRSVEWIEEARADGVPWMAFVTHSSAHTPLQIPPPALTGPAVTDISCAIGFDGLPEFRQAFKLMVESVDRSIGEMLLDLDLATLEKGVFSLRDPAETNTLIVVVNDNGSYGPTVLPPFDPTEAKQTVYESGVRSACIVAGPMVEAPGRAVDAMVNVVDLFSLLNEVCGVDWPSRIPPFRIVDAQPMLPYLTNPGQEEIRTHDFAIYEQGTFAPGDVGPCIVLGADVDGLFTNPTLCTDNGGCWLGGADVPPYPVTNYCDLATTDPKAAIVECNGTNLCFLPPSMADQCPSGSVNVVPPTLAQYAVRRGRWKLVAKTFPTCLAPDDCVVELYRLAEVVPPHRPGIENGPLTESWNPLVDELPPAAALAYADLRAEMIATLASQPVCPADGNKDGRVNGEDLAGLFSEWGGPGFWDVDESGTVDGTDLTLLVSSWGPCVPPLNPEAQGIPSCLLQGPAPLVREYDFSTGGYEDLAGSGVAIEPLGGQIVEGRYVFAAGTGLRIPTDGLDLSDYRIEIQFAAVQQVPPLAKLIDFSDRQLDRGLYRTDAGVVAFAPVPFSGPSEDPWPLGVPGMMRLERDGELDVVSLRMAGAVQWAFVDAEGSAVPAEDGAITLFADDFVTGGIENLAGAVSRIRIRSRSAE